MDAELKVLEKLFQQCQQDNGPKRIRYMNFINLTYDLETSEDENIALVKKLGEKEYVKLKLSVVGDLKSAELTRKGLTYFVEQLDVYPQIEEKIIKTLQKTYPITVNQLRKQIGLPKSIVDIELKKMQSKNILTLEPLPDKVFIRLIRTDFRFVGKRTQQKFIKRKTGRRVTTEENREYDGIMYG